MNTLDESDLSVTRETQSVGMMMTGQDGREKEWKEEDEREEVGLYSVCLHVCIDSWVVWLSTRRDP